MQEKFLVYNQNTVNYSHEIHCHEGKSPSTLNNVSTKACRSISASESDTYRKLGSPSITVSFVSFLQHRHNYRKYMKDDEEIKKGFQNWTVTEIWGQGRMEFRFNSLSPSDLGESLHFLGDSNCHFHPTAVTRNSSWGTPATASTPRFRTSLEHRFNSSCIIRLKGQALLLPCTSPFPHEREWWIWTKTEHYPSATTKLVIMQQRRGKPNTWRTNMHTPSE